ncbi:MAG: Y-family polymerase [Candidatus Saccharibacteria bacterium]|nr:Y-family polymerase [Candidatus Saccharibacteria bacterium]
MSPAPVFALIDCNNFFVSCERLFRPELTGKPVVVLSSNDGCAVSRSREAKELGIPMGAPAFKYRDLFKQHGVVQFSANFELYGDISDRITRLLTAITPRIEVYSVDESFLDLSRLEITDYAAWGAMVRERIWREIGLPVSIGIAPTKTLAKLGSAHAKQSRALSGVLSMVDMPAEQLETVLRQTPIEDIWGVGRRLAPKLKAESIFTALDLRQMSHRRAQQLMGILGRQMVNELGGLSCHPLEHSGRVRQSVMHGRMFGEDTHNLGVLEAAIAGLTAKACLRLRQSQLIARGAALSLSTDRHKPGYQQLSQYITFRTPTADTGSVSTALIRALGEVYSPSIAYHRANILLYDLQAEDALQADLFGEVDITGSRLSRSRMQAVDSLNKRYGNRTVRFAAEDLSQAWQPKHQLRSPHYTTSWNELPTAQLRLE